MSTQNFRSRAAQFAFAALAFTLLATPARATLIGNSLTSRGSSTDGDTTIFQVYFNAPVPAGDFKLNSFSIYNQLAPTDGTKNFDAFVLQPVSGSQYKVISENSFSVTALGSPGIETFPVSPIAVQPGDLIAHYGSGIPFTDSPTDTVGGSFQAIYYSTPSAPSVGDVITLPSAGFPQGTPANHNFYVRDYAFAANVTVPEPSSMVLLGVACCGLVGWVARRRRNA